MRKELGRLEREGAAPASARLRHRGHVGRGGEAKVGDPRHVVRSDEHILRFEIKVDDVVRVHGRHAAGDAAEQAYHLDRCLELVGVERVLQRARWRVCHEDHRHRLEAGTIKPHDIWVPHACKRADLTTNCLRKRVLGRRALLGTGAARLLVLLHGDGDAPPHALEHERLPALAKRLLLNT